MFVFAATRAGAQPGVPVCIAFMSLIMLRSPMSWLGSRYEGLLGSGLARKLPPPGNETTESFGFPFSPLAAVENGWMKVEYVWGPVSSASQISTLPVLANSSIAACALADRSLQRIPYRSTVSYDCKADAVTWAGASWAKW